MGGDDIGVAVSWQWPDHMDGVTGADFEKAASEIRSGKWRQNPQANDWVGKAVAKALGLDLTRPADKAKVSTMVKCWLGTGSLIIVEGQDDRRIKRQFVQVKEDKSEEE